MKEQQLNLLLDCILPTWLNRGHWCPSNQCQFYLVLSSFCFYAEYKDNSTGGQGRA